MTNLSIQNAHFLIVEDDENNRLVTCKLLQVEGVPLENIFTQPEDPVPFLRTLLPRRVDLILMDLQMPGKDGYEVLAELRNDASFEDIPVVAITANVMRDDVKQAQEAGFNGFIGKPINGPRFGEYIQNILNGEPVWAPT